MEGPDVRGEDRARLVVLVGPKGAGKTTIGRMIARRPGVYFLEVEAIAQRVLATTGNVVDESYARQAFAAIVQAVRDIERDHDAIVLETTGASETTPWFLDRLRERHDVRLVRVHARPETCASRMISRDPRRQIEVSPELIREMHGRSEALQLPWDCELDNDPPMTPDDVDRALSPLLDRTRAGDA